MALPVTEPAASRYAFQLLVGQLIARLFGERQHLLGRFACLHLLLKLRILQIIEVHKIASLYRTTARHRRPCAGLRFPLLYVIDLNNVFHPAKCLVFFPAIVFGAAALVGGRRSPGRHQRSSQQAERESIAGIGHRGLA